MFTHVARTDSELEENLHISHLHRYVSAYETNKEMVADLVQDIEDALKEAKKTEEPVIVDQDGEMCFHVHASGTITLMLPWKQYKILRSEEEEK